MGLCPSRNNAVPKHAKTYTPLPEPVRAPPTSLRADADAFVPSKPAQKEVWEQFLDQKQREASTALNGKTLLRKTDGTFTADYRRLLGEAKETKEPRAKYVPPNQRGASKPEPGHDWVQEWKQGYKKAAPRPAPAAKKKPSQAVGPLGADAKLKEALQKVKELSIPRDAALAQLDALDEATAHDDLQAPSALVPFGLTDSHYLSDTNDDAESHRHCSSIKTKPQPYAKKATITPELEERMASVLHNLRVLKQAEGGAGLAPRRYCVGIREVARILKDKTNCPLKAVLVAPDVEADGKTARGSLDERLADLIKSAQALKIPVVYGLSRTRMGQAVKKNVTVSVLGVLDVRGMNEPFEAMLRAA